MNYIKECLDHRKVPEIYELNIYTYQFWWAFFNVDEPTSVSVYFCFNPVVVGMLGLNVHH